MREPDDTELYQQGEVERTELRHSTGEAPAPCTPGSPLQTVEDTMRDMPGVQVVKIPLP